MALWQPPLPEQYHDMPEPQLADAICQRKQQLGDELVILGHHYQQDEVIQFADFTGDSFKLSQLAADRVKQVGAQYVIFLGVHFMAESADILTDERVQVILPDLGAGCSMADMANHEQVVQAWDELQQSLADENVRVVPICYMNSSAAIKAFCGEHGGAVCTSSNCDKVFEWALAGGDTPLVEGETVKILFLPDQHLGRNTAAALGHDPVTQMVLYDPSPGNVVSAIPGLGSSDGPGGIDEQALRDATFILWKGHCSVHKLFRAEHVDQIRAQWPDVTVMVHPECSYEVCQKADLTGSTEGILKTVMNAEPGSRWAIGTEVHMVNRLAKQAAEKDITVRMLSDCQCLCTTMYRIDMPHLLWALDNLVEGKVVNHIAVPKQVQENAMLALNRMLSIIGTGANVHTKREATAG